MSNTTETFELLRRMPVFGGLSNSGLSFIVQRASTISVAQGESFFHEGESGQSFFVLQAGTVVVEKVWQNIPVQVRQLNAGDCFGEMAIIDLLARSASVRAITDCLAIEITRSTLHQLYQQELEQYTIIMMNMGREVSRRLRLVSERLFEIDPSHME